MSSGNERDSPKPAARQSWVERVKPAQSGRSPASLDDLVGAAEEGKRNRQAEGFCGLQIDYQLELRRLLDRKVGRFDALQDLVDVVSRKPVHVGDTRPIGHQSASFDPSAPTSN